jgi:hypothetical protein
MKFGLKKYLISLMKALWRSLQAITEGRGTAREVPARGYLHTMDLFKGQNYINK